MSLPPAIFIIGPTASGKTGLAIKLMEHFPIELISVDSALVYKDMDIGTAKPTAEELEAAPHRLINFLDPSESYSAADFRTDALREMAEITAKGKIPVLVGGTMLYYRALENGIAEMPQADQDVREKLTKEAEQIGWDVLHQRLLEVDPVAGERIHPNDQQRIQRALEVFELTGKTLTKHQQDQVVEPVPYRLMKIALIPEEREWIRELAAIRFDQMLEAGFIDEVKALRERGDLDLNFPSMRCVGYRQAWQYLEGELDFEEMKERAVIATRQLAKRQMTYLRSEPNITEYGAKGYKLEKVKADIESFLAEE
ncbi:tRNA (adenosine(37)-N6)-dimethylallyltransferase MiaA [Cocleimonas sp. KMM 6892]|uniref:tRNA (adenosine(37)-N6)-dimethylallyltransferase MiaA n=1 Tax=unclassified Cocleimonas TaxID=2639732 RepID=UPI002DBD2DE8|nr:MULTISPECIES: tRNA (adenosine(37)-N6)-dimethylallyltransferase MiaA [unclassified Cocleimonas]MEB8430773.1 tRNA (adenosine(37)-N6)-dimethylallyltransferase MiaA [Cocleimonas sp. KMM 6892]MEC4714455.1 tRNA (adenosine(37)-N6)-dimethylallyltransferase MiaA [Cocleimonas sp. KMM 6895]MEC4743788.1 tRNA (adenosine(37)-N6)-dimethylallyltransferase MiaA [Cocleimonas sp. KMM 6896]